MATESFPPFYRDDHGYPRAPLLGRLEPLGIFLEQDVQSSATYCRELIDLATAIEDRRVSHGERTGNAYVLTATHGEFFLQNLYDEDESVLRIGPDDFRRARVAWLALIGG